MDSDSSETNLVIITKRDRVKLFCKLYWKNLIFIITPCVLSPLTFINEKNAYKCFFIFLITVVYWITDIMHPSITSLIPIALYSIMDIVEEETVSQAYITNELLDCLAVMIIIVAIEYSKINTRVAVRILLTLGCSHYRLSFLLFFTTMFLSMWITDIIACGFMIPLVNAILTELEKMGILEVYQTIGKAKQKSEHHEQSYPRPTDYTIFYYLGIAYSSSIGGMASITGSHANQILKNYCEILFPESPKIEFPHFMLLNLPGVLVMETLLYMWMNSYFMGMFRAHSSIALEIGISEEEAEYINALLLRQHHLMGKITFHEMIVGVIVIITGILQVTMNTSYVTAWNQSQHSHIKTSVPSIVSVILLFVTPINLDFLKFFDKRSSANTEPLPQFPSKACLNWDLVRKNIHWNVLLTIGGSCFVFSTLKDFNMTSELEKFLLLFKSWPTSALVLVVIIFCKIFTEFASNPCVTFCLLPNIARMSVTSDVNPHHMMMAATLTCSLPFHLITGSPTNAMVAAYVHIPHRKMMSAGVGPSIMAVAVTWFTAAVWSRAVWTNISDDPKWADVNTLERMP